MGQFMVDAVPDAMLAKIATATRQTVCSAQPANYAGIASVALAEAELTPGDGNGDFTIADGDSGGRKLTIAQQADLTIDASGDATHVVYDDGEDLLYGTTCTLQSLTEGGKVTVPSHKITVADPTSP